MLLIGFLGDEALLYTSKWPCHSSSWVTRWTSAPKNWEAFASRCPAGGHGFKPFQTQQTLHCQPFKDDILRLNRNSLDFLKLCQFFCIGKDSNLWPSIQNETLALVAKDGKKNKIHLLWRATIGGRVMGRSEMGKKQIVFGIPTLVDFTDVTWRMKFGFQIFSFDRTFLSSHFDRPLPTLPLGTRLFYSFQIFVYNYHTQKCSVFLITSLEEVHILFLLMSEVGNAAAS